MVWRKEDPQGRESQKIALDAVPYLNGRVLDLGCGPHRVFPARHILGIDTSSVAAGALPMDCTKLDLFSDGGVDTVFSSHFLEHVEDYKAALKEWWRVLAVGGFLCLYLPHKDLYPNIGEDGANPDHKHDFVPADITEAMREVAWRSGKGWKQVKNETRGERNEYSFWQVYQKQATVACEEWVEKPRPPKSLGLIRLGALGDAVWMTAVTRLLKAEGWHITAYVQSAGHKVLKSDPNIDDFVIQADGLFAGPSEFERQMEYWHYLSFQHDKIVNLCGSVERRMLYQMFDQYFYNTYESRQVTAAGNYMESICEFAGIKYDPATFKVRFTPLEEEVAWAKEQVGNGPFVLINPKGSGVAKYWPYTQTAMDMLAMEGVRGAVVGELGPAGHKPLVAAKGWQIIGDKESVRKVFAMAQLADVVIGPESSITNSVSHEPNLKIVFLSHSSVENLTRDWQNTISCTPVDLACYPCHRVHPVPDYCSFDKKTKQSQCHAQYAPQGVVEVALNYLNRRQAA